jgi:hypothetical protein
MPYYIGIDGVQQGPFELHELLSRGLRPDVLVWKEGMPDWQRADAVPDVAALLQGPQPQSAAQSMPEPAQPDATIPLTPDPAQSPAAPAQPLPYMRPPQPHELAYGRATDANGMALASMILGIVSYPISFFASCAGIVPAILAVIFGFIARNRVKRGETTVGNGQALAGIILGMIHLGLLVIGIIIVAIFFGVMASQGGLK